MYNGGVRLYRLVMAIMLLYFLAINQMLFKLSALQGGPDQDTELPVIYFNIERQFLFLFSSTK